MQILFFSDIIAKKNPVLLIFVRERSFFRDECPEHPHGFADCVKVRIFAYLNYILYVWQ